jgi:hypothetical protein
LKIRIYNTIILPFVLYGYETWSVTFREETKLQVFENKVPRKISEPEKDDVSEQFRIYITRNL